MPLKEVTGCKMKHVVLLAKKENNVVMAYFFLLGYTLNAHASLMHVDRPANNWTTLNTLKITPKSLKFVVLENLLSVLQIFVRY